MRRGAPDEDVAVRRPGRDVGRRSTHAARDPLGASIGGAERSTTRSAISVTSRSARATARCACACALPSSRRSRSARCCYYLHGSQARAHRAVLARARLEHEFIGPMQDVLRHMLDLVPASDGDRRRRLRQSRAEASTHSAPIRCGACSSSGGARRTDPAREHRASVGQGMTGATSSCRPERPARTCSCARSAAGFLLLRRQLASQANGLRVEDQPDYFYGRGWPRPTARRSSEGPRLEDVDAIVNTPRHRPLARALHAPDRADQVARPASVC